MSNVRSAQTDKVRFFGNTTPQELAAQYGTPLYVYNEDVLRQRCRELLGLSSLPGFHVNYSAKANTNLALLRIVREEGCHADAMSPGELHINKLAGFTPDRLLYVCNNVSAEEMKNAADNGLIVSVDSLSQLDQYGKVNPGGKVMIRINPGIGAGHHKKVITAGKETKFGIDPTSLDEVRTLLKKHSLTLAGVNQHIGSLFMEPDNYLNAIEFLLHFVQSDLADLLPGIEIIDFGGGLGIPYRKYEEEPRLDMAELGRRLHALLSAWVEETGYKGKFFIEPGRYVVAECGVLLGTVHATKFNGENRYVGTDLGFNVLVRPAMYDSFHDIEIFRDSGEPDTDLVEQSIVGNICESGDILAKKRMLPLIKEGDIVAALDAGAYGFVMSSSYNQRPRAAEVLITSDGTPKLIRRRETLDDLTRCFVGGNLSEERFLPSKPPPSPSQDFRKVDAETGGKAAEPLPRVSRQHIKRQRNKIQASPKPIFPGLPAFSWFIIQRDSRRAASPPVESLWRWRGGGGRTFLQKVLPPLPDSSPYFPNRRKRSALSTTETDEKAIAAPAIMGESEGPPKILSTPAAMGRQRML